MTRPTIESLAHEAFRTNAVTPELRAFAWREIERRGLRATIDAINAKLERAFGGEA